MNYGTQSGPRLRRAALSILAAASMAAALAGCGSGGSSGDTASPSSSQSSGAPTQTTAEGSEIVIASYGGAFQEAQKKAYFDPFAEGSGIGVTITEGASYDKVKAMVESGQVDWDVVTVDGPTFAILTGDDSLLEPINYDVVQADGVPDSLKEEYGIGYLSFAQVLASDNAVFPSGLTPEQFFDPSVEARRVLRADPTFTFEFALLADGVEPADLYPLDVDRAFEVLDRIKDQVVGFKGTTDVQTLIQQGEVDAAFVGNGRIEDVIATGSDWAYTWEGAIAVMEYWVVPKGAREVEGAMEFIDYATSPEPQAAMSEVISYGPTNENAFDHLDEERAAILPSYPANAELGAVLDAEWWADNIGDVQARWDSWLLN